MTVGIDLNLPAQARSSIVLGHRTIRKDSILPFLMMVLAVSVTLVGSRDFPITSMLFMDTAFCVLLVYMFSSGLRFVFLLHPIVLGILGLFYEASFRELGDGPAYFLSTRDGWPLHSGVAIGEYLKYFLLSAKGKGFYFGFIPNILIPEWLYVSPSDTVYYLWQASFHVALVCLCVLLAKRWHVLRDEHLFFIAAYAVISPSFLELGCTPTRHYFTFFSILLFYVSFHALAQSFTLAKLFWLIVSIASVAVSKLGYFVPIVIYCAYYLVLSKSSGLPTVPKYVLAACLIGLTVYVGPFFADLLAGFAVTAKTGAASFGFLANGNPIVSIPAKYLYAILSPFPWQKAAHYVATIYGGNWPFFVMHVLSALIGLYFFLRVGIYWRALFKSDADLRMPVYYGLIMSLSILRGATGYHNYLSIFFPFLAVLFAVPKHRLCWAVPVMVALGIEGVYTVAVDLV